MPFDPDKYLAKVGKTVALNDFNPDAYLAKNNSQVSTVIDEMHPDISFADRALIKNFGNDINSSIEYLKKQHPNLDVKQINGEIVAKRPKETAYKKLDPSGFDLQDITDLGTDVLSGVGTGFFTTAGGLAGNLPGAVAAGTASSAGAEALKQWLGELAGVNQGVSGSDVALSGAFGAASPLLLGSGASLAQAGKQALKEGGKRTAEEILSANRGAISRAAAPVAEMASGISKDILGTFYKNADKIKSLDDTGIKEFALTTGKKVADVLNKEHSAIGKEIGDTIKQLPGKVDISQTTQDALGLLKEFKQQATELGTPASKEAYRDLKSVYNKYLSKKVTQKAAESASSIPGLLVEQGKDAVKREPIKEVSAKSAWELAKSLEHFGKIYDTAGSPFSRHAASASVGDKRISNAAVGVAKNIRESLNQKSGGALSELNAKFSEIGGVKDELENFIKDPKSTYKSLSNILSPANRVTYETVANIDKAHKTGVINDAKLLAAYKQFSKAPWLAISSQGTTSTSRTIPSAALGAGLGYYLGAQSGLGQGGAGVGAFAGGGLGAILGGPRAMKAYMQAIAKSKAAEDALRQYTGGKIPVTKSTVNSVWNAMTGNQGG